MPGPIALHGGGEFRRGDEPFLEALLQLAPERDGAIHGAIHVAIVPTAAARGRPGRTAADGVAAFERTAARVSRTVVVEAVPIVDRASAMDADAADRLAAATLIHLPGGDPDIIPGLFPGSRAWAALQVALAAGAVLAGASAGAMALGSLTWTPGGLVAGLGIVPQVLVVPHADARAWDRAIRRSGIVLPADIGVLGLAERTGVIVTPGEPWLVVGAGQARWLPPGIRDPAATQVAGHGARIGP